MNRTYVFNAPDKRIYATGNLTQFCKEHNLTRSALSAVANRRQKQHKGWTLGTIGEHSWV